jgi:hypothetical protein
MSFRKSFNKTTGGLWVAQVLLCGFAIGCCVNHLHKDPPYPGDVETGWRERDTDLKGLQVRGVFILKKGEAVDNGEIQVKVVDIIANDPCDTQGVNSLPKVTIQLRRMSDQVILCTGTYTEKAYGVLPADCGSEAAELGISGYRINAINLSKGWVLLELHG